MSDMPSTTTSRRPRRGRKLISLAASVALAGSLAVAAPAFADESVEASSNGGIIEAIANFFGLGKADEGVEIATAGEEKTEADGSTLTAWESHLSPDGDSTQNIGRIWTDKTVQDGNVTLQPVGETVAKGDSDFLVGLSALSSMSQIQMETTTPLDIVLVLDTSGSMQDVFGGEPEYEEVYSSDSDYDASLGRYYVLDDGEYYRLNYPQGNDDRYYWYKDGVYQGYVTPKTSAGDNSNQRVQFYRVKNSRLAALKDAVNNFIDTTDKINADITDNAQKHQIALVNFGHSAESSIVRGLASDAAILKNDVSGLMARNGTRTDIGMELGKRALESARDGAQKVVIFFTDGEPSESDTSTNWSDDTANKALGTAKDMEDEGALVYSVGVFDGADANVHVVDPNKVSTKFNAFMNGVSSNYPDAVSYTNLGNRVGAQHQYYKPASNAEELSQIFSQIAEEIQTVTSSSPIASGGAGGEAGYLTFTDTLGKYMEVDSVKSIVYANHQFTQSSSSTDEDASVTTYVFDQDVTDTTGIFQDGNLNQIIIKVQKYPEDLSKGDTITVEVPANLIPLRNYKASVDKEGDVTWGDVTAAYPIRVFYGVSLKADAADAIKSGTTGNDEADAALKEYIEANTSEIDGHKSVNFLSNLFEGAPGEGSGTTTAKFTPADSNGYYYVQENTPLYVYAGEEPENAKDIDPSKLVILNSANYDQYNPTNVYYKQTVYKEGAAQAVDEIVAIPVDKFAEGVEANMVEGDEANGYYLVKGSPRLTRITEFEDTKGELAGSSNATNTAALAVNPNWDKRAAGAGITVQLGNNGKLSVELPGELRVSKEVTVADGLNKDQFKDTEFSFTVHVDGMVNQNVWAQVVNTDGGAVVGEKKEVALDGQGNYTTTLKDGQTLVVTGLNDGAEYTVTENLPQDNGFTQSSEGATGAISSNVVAEAKFTNHYAATQATAQGVNAQKKFTDADTGAEAAWDGATFDFVIEAQPGNASGGGSRDAAGNAITNVADIPMPDGSSNGEKHQTVDSADAFDFGTINYAKPGTYVYHVWEQTPEVDADNWLAGVAYSAAVYHVKIVVKDDGQGALYVDEDASTMYMELTDDGDETNATDKTDIAVIGNTYKKDTAQAQFQATKTLFDATTGTSRIPDDGRFKFAVEAVGGTAKDGSEILPADVPLMKVGVVQPNSGSSVVWSHIEFTNAMEGNTYTYKLYESQPTVDGKYESAGVDSTAKQNDNGEWVWRGITYDKTVYTAEVQVSVDVENEGQPNERQHVHADIVYKDAEGNVVFKEDGTTHADRVPFANTYAVTSVGGSVLTVQKTLDGRVMNDGEEFTFTQTLIAGDGTGVSGLSDTATVTGDGAKTVDTSSFGVPTFTKPGTYTFQIEEQGTNGNGLKYDTHKATVTYVVNDTSEDGTIEHTGNLRVVSVTYDNSKALTEADRAETDVAAFTNTYRTNTTFDGITVSKTLNGRAMVAGEFNFTITPQNQNAIDRKIANSDAQFSNKSNSASGVTENMTGKLTSLKFTQADKGKDFTYLIDEIGHKDGSSEGDKPGVTYDTKRYHLTIHVGDDGNGALTATSTIKLADADGNPVGETVPAAFVNEYAPSASNAVTPTLNKILTGRDWTDDDTFTFDIEKVSATIAGMTPEEAVAAMPLPMKDGSETTSVTLNANGEVTDTKSGASVPVDFGNLTFAKAGTYQYKVTEVIPGDATNEAVKDDNGLIPYENASADQKKQSGWKKGGTTYTVRPTVITVTVTSNTAEGKLEAAITQDNRGNFRNSYAASQSFDGAVSFQLTKQLNGHHMAANQFQFNVTALDGVNVNAADTAMKFHLSEDGKVTSIPVPGAAGEDGQQVVMSAGSKQVVFTQADSGKTFKMQFDEVQPNPIPSGYTYDNAKYVMEVTPTDLGNGTMSIATKVTKAWTDAEGKEQSEVIEHTWRPGEDKATVSADFVNEYNSTGTLALDGTKTIGESWVNGPADFEFTVEQVGNADGDAMTADTAKAVLPNPATATSGEDGTFTFGKITFNESGTYYFKVSEIDGKIPGVGYVSDGKVVTVNVVEEDANGNGNGNLVATVADGSPELTFANTYTQTASDPYSIDITKAVAGHDAAAEQFEFQLIADEAAKAAIESGAITGVVADEATGVVAVESNKAAIDDGKSEGVSFAGMTFTKVTEGDGYTFTVKEVVGNDDDPALAGIQNAGWTMDTHEYKANIKVADVDSKLTVTATPADGSPSIFSNTFGAATTLGANGDLRVTKQLDGRTLEADQFDFVIQVAENSENAAAAVQKLADLDGVADGVLSFKNVAPGDNGIAAMDELGGLAFDQGDIGKTFTYVVSEKIDTGLDGRGYTYDPEPEATVEITVKEGDDGKIYTETKVTKGNDVKIYGTYVEGADAETAVVPFVNSYAASGSASVEAAKTLHNRDMAAGEFEFGIVPQGSAQDGTADVVTAVNDADGKVSFMLDYTIEQLSELVADGATWAKKNTDGTWTLSYTAYEKTNLPDGVTADKASFDFTVTVKDNGDGTLTATPAFASAGANTFENTYGKDAKASASIAATKTLHGRDQQNGEFKFSVKQGKAESAGIEVLTGTSTEGKMDAAATVMFTGKAEGAAVAEQGVLGEYTFESLQAAVDAGWATYDAPNKTWTLNYSISELTDSANMPEGVQVTAGHPDHYDFTVTVVDDGKGGLTATTNYPQNDKATFDFDNTYGQGASAATPVAGTKTLAGESASALDITGKYTFTLVNEDGSEVTEHKADGFVTSETNPDKNGGSVTLGDLVFTMNDIKDVAFENGVRSKAFTYKVTETETDGAVPGVTNDADAGADKGKTITVTLTDDGQGHLTATATDFAFVNTYAPGTIANTPVGVTKKLTGDRDQSLQAGEFEFEATVAPADDKTPGDGAYFVAADGSHTMSATTANMAPTATEGDNANVGAVAFGDITFAKPGTYTVTVTEKVPSGDKTQPFMEYNVGDNVYSYNVEVKAGGETLTAEIVDGSMSGSMQFVNNYEKPEKSVSELPESGIQVGDELTYTIEWANTTSVVANIAVSDELTQGLAYVDDSQSVSGVSAEGVDFKAEGQNLSWTFNAEPNTSGTVTFKAKVTEDVLTIEGGTLDNKATIAVGNNPSVDTNVVPVPKPETGDLTISKTVASSDAGVEAPSQEFTFNVELKDKKGAALAGEYSFEGTSDGSAGYSGKVSNGGAIVLKDKGSVTIKGLPAGATYKVTETALSGWAASFGDAGDSGMIAAGATAAVAVTNTYTPGSVTLSGAGNLKVQKVLEGDRDWLANEKYTFEISAVTEGAPMPERTTLELGKPADGKAQAANFGDISFTETGTYEYRIVETGKSADGNLTFSRAEYKVVVTVGKDKADPSKLAASSVMTRMKNDKGEAVEAEAAGNTAVFTNTYTKPEQKKDVVSVDDPKTSINGKLVGVDDELTYTINWVNDAVNDEGKAAEAEVTITDNVPAGTEFVNAENGGQLSDDGKTITWNLGKQDANASGTVSFTVKVTDAAVSVDEIENKATINIGGNKVDTNVVTNTTPKKTVGDNKPEIEGDVQVGDELVYAITWANTTGETANVVITDVLPKGLTFLEASDGGACDESTNTVTWTLANQPNGADGKVTVRVVVNDDALTLDNLNNKATLNIGDKQTVSTNTVPGPKPSAANGGLVIGKQVTIEEGRGIDEAQAKAKSFTFEVSVVDAEGKAVTGEFNYLGQDAEGKKLEGKLTLDADGKGAIGLADGQSVEVTGLPSGSTYTVTEAKVEGYTALVPSTDKDEMVEGNSITGKLGFGQALATAFFQNHYQVGEAALSGATNLEVTKHLTGRDWAEEDSFAFVLSANMDDAATKAAIEAGNITLPENAKGLTIGSETPDHKAAFGDITFNQAGDFQFYITEQQGDLGGVSYDTAGKLVKVHVADNGNGTLTATVTEGANPTVTNEYKPGGTFIDTAGLFTKLFVGKDWADEKFSFEIEAQGDAPAAENTETEVTKGSAPAETAAGSTGELPHPNTPRAFGFGFISFSGVNMYDADNNRVFEKTFEYKVWENHPADAVRADDFGGRLDEAWIGTDGITYDGHVATLLVTVADDGEGNLAVADVKVSKGNFSNLFEAVAENVTTVQIAKTLTGRDMVEGETFTFDVKASDDASADRLGISAEGTQVTTPAAKDGVRSVVDIPLNALSFTQQDVGASYEFIVSEVDDAKGGVTYDDTEYTVKIAVSQESDGSLVVTTTVADNKGSEPVVRTHKQGDAAEPVVLSFANSYHSEMTEVDSAKTNATFSKVLEGRDWLDGDEFAFELTPKTNGAPMPKDAEGNSVNQVTVTKDNAAKFSFGEIEFTYDMVKGEPNKTKDFVYEVTEVQPNEGSIAGVTYDKHVATMTITVADNGKGELTATVKTENGAFTNKYESSLDYGAAGGLKLTKVLTGRDMMDGQFEFTVAANGEDGLGIAGDYTAPATKNGEAATVDLLGGKTVTFTQADAGKTYAYTAVEQPGDVDGYDYDPTTYTVTVAVADNNNGTLTVTTTVAGKGEPQVYTYTTGETPEASAVVPFENSYSAGPVYLGGEGNVQLKATKTLTGRDMSANEFGFTVTNVADGSQVAAGSNEAAADGEAGAVTFTPIEYTSTSLYEDAATGKAQASKADPTTGAITYTYQYNVAETKGLTDGVSGVATSFTVTVKVTDNNNGTLTVAVEYPEGSDSLAFVNTYGANAAVDVTANGQKVLKVPEGTGYNAPDIAGKYTFTLTGSEGAPMPEQTTATNDAAGNVSFGTIHYTMGNVFGDAGAADEPAGDADAAADELAAGESVAPAKSDVRMKTFAYTVTEAGSVDGVANDANATQTFTVTVTDNGDGTLTAVADPATGAKFSFTNTYTTDPVTLQGDTAIQGKKTITGRPLADSEFSFRLSALSEGTPMPEQATVTNDANGNFAFGAMTFTEPGTYQYQVSEVKGNAGGVTYDTAIYNVTVTVTDNGAGKLVAETTATKAGGDGTVAIAFTNKYEAAAGTLVLGASKTLAGAELAAGQFTFELTGSEGAPLPAQTTATNDANGQVTFPVIEFAKPGEYTYTISEVNDGQEGVTYDDGTYTVNVTVSETNAAGGYDGTLHVTATYADGKAPVFANSYEPPAEPGEPGEPGTPDEPQPKPLPSPGGMVATGDSSMLLVALTVAAGSIAALVAAALGLRRARKMR